MIDYERSNNTKNLNNHHRNPPPSSSSSDLLPDGNGTAVTQKRKRRPAGTPDPEAEVVSLSPRTLLESDRYVCEICNQGFQRDQNLQMHRRRHKVPWKLLKRETNEEVRKRVYVCPEPTCLHHNPCHALGDLVGIKKHFRRKHSNHKQWICERCSKGYAVQSDYKAHLKTCGTRGHSCDCGRVFSRVESFIEHQDNCTVRRSQPSNHRLPQQQHTTNGTQSTSTADNSENADLSIGPILPGHPLQRRQSPPSDQQPSSLLYPFGSSCATNGSIELQLLPSRYSTDETSLSLSIGTLDQTTMSEVKRKSYEKGETSLEREEARREVKRQIEIAELEFAEAKRIRQHARAELHKAQLFREEASRRISATMMLITCHNCKQHFQAPAASVPPPSQPHCTDESTSLAVSYVSSATTEGEKASDRASS
ncbi:PREDICTED: protein indeterminate-domain 14 [Camelina sativa]|uniref:Protein indeterminate-domain 14 n=1 Tax=Camelina sativa TaxID=90675 RepID=A0ABM0SS88_CAMSA|nr:PREDICTED: protein indeterminate-domain 14 [Camelina sativa]XP_010415405.1 PREDICTED: protein indeterminate-domain 14 [Camelina sativa]